MVMTHLFYNQSFLDLKKRGQSESQTERERPKCFQQPLPGKIPHMHKMQLKSFAVSAGLARNPEQITPYFYRDK